MGTYGSLGVVVLAERVTHADGLDERIGAGRLDVAEVVGPDSGAADVEVVRLVEQRGVDDSVGLPVGPAEGGQVVARARGLAREGALGRVPLVVRRRGFQVQSRERSGCGHGGRCSAARRRRRRGAGEIGRGARRGGGHSSDGMGEGANAGEHERESEGQQRGAPAAAETRSGGGEGRHCGRVTG